LDELRTLMGVLTVFFLENPLELKAEKVARTNLRVARLKVVKGGSEINV